jgi:mono/diheme cytochrome c family protein
MRQGQIPILHIPSIHVNFSSMRVKSLFLLTGLCLTLSATGCATSAEKPAAAVAVTPRVLYERNCAVCHGPQGQGTELGTMKVPPLNSGAALNDPDEKFYQQINDGGKGMPPFKATLDDKQIEDLVRFIREELQGKK